MPREPCVVIGSGVGLALCPAERDMGDEASDAFRASVASNGRHVDMPISAVVQATLGGVIGHDLPRFRFGLIRARSVDSEASGAQSGRRTMNLTWRFVNTRCVFHNVRSEVNVLMLTTADLVATG